MSPELKQDLQELMVALQELAYGVMLTAGQVTAAKVLSATEKVKVQLELEDATK